MAASDFTLVPTLVVPDEPEFNNLETPSESMKKNYLNLSSTPILRYKLIFEGMSNTNFWALHKHVYDRYVGYDSFSWQSVPAYIDTDMDGTPDGSNLTGRWVKDTFKFDPGPDSWDAEIVFEKAN